MVGKCRVIRGVTDVKLESAAIDSDSQLVYGEHFDAEYCEGDWVIGSCVHDGFVGYVRRDALSKDLVEPTHTIGVMWAPVLRGPFLRFKPCDFLTLGSRIRVVGQQDQFYSLADDVWVYKAHVVEGVLLDPNYIAMAEKLVGIPFVWGGRTTYGFDCTGIIQFVLGLAGIPSPRDVPEQAAQLGHAVETPQRGDLFFLERRGHFFHAGLFTSETHVINGGYRFAGVGVQNFAEIYNLYRLAEDANGTLDQFQVHVRRISQQGNGL
jgi:hypothetical protein